ncbi:biotin/lipoyl-containing protein [Nocardia thailandica]|uniref:Biotin/lipoyl-containing protein n=1 Tax=Nocardia thailandica TaxID=257275 RepID=A0ABW6PVE1_9NOCA
MVAGGGAGRPCLARDPDAGELGGLDLTVDGRPFTVRVRGYDGDTVLLRPGDAAEAVPVVRGDGDVVTVDAAPVSVRRRGAGWTCRVDGVVRELDRAEYRGSGAAAAGPAIRSPMPGTLVRLHVSSGEQVEQGQLLGVVEAMKLEHELAATHAGVVTVTAAEGAVVTTDESLFLIEERGAAL